MLGKATTTSSSISTSLLSTSSYFSCAGVALGGAPHGVAVSPGVFAAIYTCSGTPHVDEDTDGDEMRDSIINKSCGEVASTNRASPPSSIAGGFGKAIRSKLTRHTSSSSLSPSSTPPAPAAASSSFPSQGVPMCLAPLAQSSGSEHTWFKSRRDCKPLRAQILGNTAHVDPSRVEQSLQPDADMLELLDPDTNSEGDTSLHHVGLPFL